MKKLTIYLASGIESAKNWGVGWREEITPFLEELGLKVLNPCEFEPEQLRGLQPGRLPEYFMNVKGEKVVPTHWHHLKEATESHLYNRFLKYMRRIIHYDIKIVEQKTDYIICYWNATTAAGAGTHSELTAGFLKNIPIYAVEEKMMPGWARACCSKIFKTFDELKDFLKEEFDYNV